MKNSLIVSIFFGMFVLAPFGNLVVASGSMPEGEVKKADKERDHKENDHKQHDHEMHEEDEEE